MLNIGMNLTLESLESNNPDKYKCKIADIENNNLYIDYPISLTTNRTAFLVNDLHLNCIFSTEDNGTYLFRTKVIGKVKKNIPLIILHIPPVEEFKKIQRRQYVRVETAVDISLYLQNSKERFTTITEDISAGGCAVLLPKNIQMHPLETGDATIVLPMQNGDYQYINTPIKLIRNREDAGKNIASIEFIDLDEKDTQSLFRFCFERQLELRKKGLLT
nr:flagellar brake domain-containing protein [Heyndrickxia oleronia]